jgi:hypothetical protein
MSSRRLLQPTRLPTAHMDTGSLERSGVIDEADPVVHLAFIGGGNQVLAMGQVEVERVGLFILVFRTVNR